MRILSSIANVDAPSSDYPGGRIRNKNNTVAPPVVGSPIVEEIYGDVLQFFQRLLVLGGVTPNDLPDNETNNYQTVIALLNSVNLQLKASDADAKTGTLTTKFLTPANLEAVNNKILKRAFPIGSWNMDTTADAGYAFSGGVNMDKFVSIKAIIFNDAKSKVYPIDYCDIVAGGEHPDGSVFMDGNYARLRRRTGGLTFDNSDFATTPTVNGVVTRGYIIIEHYDGFIL